MLEASGGVTFATLRGIAETGVERISVGALTHSAVALDIALDYLSCALRENVWFFVRPTSAFLSRMNLLQ